jgi:hypothetical protein
MADDVDGHPVSETTHHFTPSRLHIQCVFLLHFGLLDLANLVLVATGKAVADLFAANADGDMTVVQRPKTMSQAQCAFPLKNLGQTGRFPWSLLVTLDVVTDLLLVDGHVKMITECAGIRQPDGQ